MWWLTLPLFSAVVGCIAMDGLIPYFFNRLLTGNPYLRRLETVEQRRHYLRDLRLSGGAGAHKQLGLENLD